MSYQIKEDKVSVIPNAINPDLYESERFDNVDIQKDNQLDSRFIIGFVGLFVPWHGIIFLLGIFQRLAQKYPFAHLLLVGDGPERPIIEKRIREMGMEDRITLTGYVSHELVPSYVRAFDVAVMANSNIYGSPMKIFEYMGMGRAIVAPAYGPIKEILTDGKNALLFEPNRENEVYDAIAKLINDRALVKKLGENARKDALKKHTWGKNALEIENILYRIDRKAKFQSKQPSLDEAISIRAHKPNKK